MEFTLIYAIATGFLVTSLFLIRIVPSFLNILKSPFIPYNETLNMSISMGPPQADNLLLHSGHSVYPIYLSIHIKTALFPPRTSCL